jgi:hypothetical protein
MSGTFPALPGIDQAIKRTPIYSTVVQVAPSGKEARAAFTATPRYRYELPVNFLRQVGYRTGIADELALIQTLFDNNKGRWDTFSFTDPVDGVMRTCRFDQDNLPLEKIAEKAWKVDGAIVLFSVKP